MLLSYTPTHSMSLPAHYCLDRNLMGSMSLDRMHTTSATHTNSTLQPLLPTSPSRPKLSLNTRSILPTFGKRSTSLRLETLSASSPTSRNTFQNATDAPKVHESSKSPLNPLPLGQTCEAKSSPTEATLSSTSSCSSVSSEALSISCVPYTLPYGLKSALRNSPTTRIRTQTTTFAICRPMFPAAKRVAFRDPITEDVKTVRFTLRHSDISPPTSTLELRPPQERHPNKSAQPPDEKPTTKKSGPLSPRTGDKRDSSDEEDDETCPATPVAGRQKRHRQWVWTLPPVPRSAEDSRTGAASDQNGKKADGEGS